MDVSPGKKYHQILDEKYNTNQSSLSQLLMPHKPIPQTTRAKNVPSFMLPTRSSRVKEDDRVSYRRKIEEKEREDMEKRSFKGSFMGKNSAHNSRPKLESVQVSVMSDAEHLNYQTMPRDQRSNSTYTNP